MEGTGLTQFDRCYEMVLLRPVNKVNGSRYTAPPQCTKRINAVRLVYSETSVVMIH